CNDKTGCVIGIQQVTDHEELLLISSEGHVVRMKVHEIPVIGRNTQGVRLVTVGDDRRVVCVEKLME
ncbi:MAG: hypothetical protein GWM98_30015, partial [Nitrospinaceae bacterium]|nr:hypothetical protein [Nitrospinaceae bacterium]NIR57929.1 hypothetical protein [Nitrospinaceae bacterium]NIS88389.1 hypothetical protein [Nitrospinaceae bacterium]NIT85265.1 hypothetical protein [Nitrospinaceae bacterium]NIU47420.1 hypothetical protein [Nitrospinaceae bacterium]